VYPNIFQIPVDMFLESLAELEGLTQVRKYFAVEFPHPEFFVAAIKLRRYGFPIIYEILDDWEEFHKVGQATWYQRGVEEAFVVNANLITAVSQPLVDKFAGIRRDIHLSPNGFNPALLGKGSHDIARKVFKGAEIHVGYFGHLTDAWFDWDLVLRVVDLARERGVNVYFDLIGYGNPDLEKRLEKYRDKVKLHGKVQPGELYKYACEWDVAMIPFKKGKLSQAVDPLKIYEYLYFGLGVIVTGIEHLKALPRVEVVGDAEEFLGALVRMREVALGGTEDKEEERVAEVLARATWEERFSRLVGILEAGKWMSL
jgi:glycosyltransferase involved in cell wall biosynthesis